MMSLPALPSLSVVETLGVTLRVLRAHWLRFAAVLLLPIPLAVGGVLLIGFMAAMIAVVWTGQTHFRGEGAVVAAGILGSLIALCLAYTACYGAAIDLMRVGLAGERPSVRASLRLGLGRLWPMSVAYGLASLPTASMLLLSLAPLVATGTLRSAPLAAVIVLGALLPLGYVGVRLVGVGNAVILEGYGGTAALGRAWEVSRGSFVHLLALTLTVCLVGGVIQVGVDAAMRGASGLPLALPLLLLVPLSQAFFHALWTGATTVAYLDLRQSRIRQGRLSPGLPR